ncbi:MAG: hypothetical protein JJU28_12060 [Cyclobacteriaceae bacterium]|nr:hypothetical protein [Cyclobacteriaceae bacterium]
MEGFGYGFALFLSWHRRENSTRELKGYRKQNYAPGTTPHWKDFFCVRITDATSVSFMRSNQGNLFDFYYCNRSNDIRTEMENWNHWTGGVRKTAYRYFQSDRRMKAKVWSTNYLTHSTGGFETKFQRRSLGIWSKRSTDEVSVSVNAKTYHPYTDNIVGKAYIPIPYIPGPPHLNLGINRGTIPRFNQSHAFVRWPPYIMMISFTPGSSILKQCKPIVDFPSSLSPYAAPPYPCKPGWKFSMRVKIKESESCHYVRRGNQDREIQIYINKNVN